MEPTLIYSNVTKGWLYTYFTKIWFFEELNIVCTEVFIKSVLSLQHRIHTVGGTEHDRCQATEFLNEFCEVAQEDY
jgi:hypothetical protein